MSRLDSLKHYQLPETVEVKLPAGEVFVFRCPRSRAELAEHQAQVEMLKTLLEEPPEAWKPFLPIPPEAIPEICLLQNHYVGDDMAQIDWIRLQHECGIIHTILYSQFMLQVGERLALLAKQEIESTKKNSDGTDSTEPT